MRANATMVYAWAPETRRMEWTFPGSKVDPVGFTVPDRGLDERDDSAFVHGFKQKIGDAAALGQGATAAERRDAMQAVVDTLESGRWNAERGEGDGSMLARAIAEVRAMSPANVAAFLKGKTPRERTALAALPRYSEKIAEYRAARAAGVDTDALEAEIDGI